VSWLNKNKSSASLIKISLTSKSKRVPLLRTHLGNSSLLLLNQINSDCLLLNF